MNSSKKALEGAQGLSSVVDTLVVPVLARLRREEVEIMNGKSAWDTKLVQASLVFKQDSPKTKQNMNKIWVKAQLCT